MAHSFTRAEQKKGGQTANAKLTPEQRSEKMRAAVNARWKNATPEQRSENMSAVSNARWKKAGVLSLEHLSRAERLRVRTRRKKRSEYLKKWRAARAGKAVAGSQDVQVPVEVLVRMELTDKQVEALQRRFGAVVDVPMEIQHATDYATHVTYINSRRTYSNFERFVWNWCARAEKLEGAAQTVRRGE